MYYYIDMETYDAILYIEPMVNEDDRYPTTTTIDAGPHGNTQYTNWDDPKLWSSNAFGRILNNELNNMSTGFSAEVTEFAKWIVVRVSHSNYLTGRTSSKTFLIVFSNKDSGIVLSTANKWRTISGYSQAVSYIKSASQILKNSTSQKI